MCRSSAATGPRDSRIGPGRQATESSFRRSPNRRRGIWPGFGILITFIQFSEAIFDMAKKLYVGNLSYSVDNNELEGMFAVHGTVQSANIITDRDTGRSKGFGFVEMANDTQAQAAIDALHGKEIGGRSLTVNEARPREDRGGFGGGGGGRRDGGFGGGRRF